MGVSNVFSLQPTFTQGLIIGQLSILILLAFILKYLFLDSPQNPFQTSHYNDHRFDAHRPVRKQNLSSTGGVEDREGIESAEWFNMLMHQVTDIYRAKLRNGFSGLDGDDHARVHVENYANKMRPQGFLDYIEVKWVDLGVSAPRLSNARIKRQKCSEPLSEVEFEVSYTDTVSLEISTSYLVNYPMPAFARLPISLTISLSQFKASMVVTPPSPSAESPAVTLTLLPNFTLDLTTTSRMGSRVELVNVPKLHELIQHQVHRSLASQKPWRVVLPGLSTATEVRHALKEVQVNPA
ncbi:unnamed protein product [Mycena citricolor]|uniref:SMP-LTD domain-containing protein n=1 Tax=Mycena citricolor TaxID=2018698 RepID=A0AAD2GZI5_9AGAR|nr:unnamed protein product [Mycena citricolor]